MPGVLDQLIAWGLKGHVLKFIQNFLSHRTFQVVLGNCRSKIFDEETGVPQGSVIAVTLFLVRMNGVFTRLPVGIFIFVYADDIVLMAIKETVKALRRKIIQATAYISNWASNAGFQMSAAKSGYTHICPSNHRILSTKISIQDEVIPFRKTLRILGVHFDRSLTFNTHLNEVKSAKQRLNILRTLAGRHPNANRTSRFNVAKAIVNSRLTYGIEATYLAKPRLVERLTPVYQQALRISSGLLPGTPGIAACIEGGVLPFDRLITATICKRAIGLNEITSGTDEEGSLLKEANKFLREISNRALPPVCKTHWVGARGWNKPPIKTDHTIKRHFKAGSNPFAVNQAVLDLQRRTYAGYAIRYSDGSVAQKRVGIGISGDHLKECHRLPDECSIFSAEAAAAFIAVTTPDTRPIALFTDSASVVTALESATSRHPWIQAIQEYAPPNTVFIWLPGHCGVKGNEEADHLAGTGRRMTKYTRKVPGQDLKKWVTKTVDQSWSRDWLAGSILFIRKIKGDTSRWEDPPLHREQVVLSRLRSGHTNVSHNYKGDGPFRRICDHCHIPQTVEHFICICPKYDGTRRSYDISGSIRDVLSDDPVRTATLFIFLKETGLFNMI
ncbi:uncharacterized protein LOC135697366 [Ochlerotatus camptorhynchus]|uniref:uncharacterized protein LOC135697366 n=1 Tax=Ochlerotatus camptorhynchus TaxID=644619 RepID=UPI0031DDB585